MAMICAYTHDFIPDLDFFEVAFEFCPPSSPFHEPQLPYAEDQLVVNP